MADKKEHLLALLGFLKSGFQTAAKSQSNLFRHYPSWNKDAESVDEIIGYVSKAPSLHALDHATDVDTLNDGCWHRRRVENWVDVFAGWAGSEYARPEEAAEFGRLSRSAASILSLLPLIR